MSANKEIEFLARGVLICKGMLLVCHNKKKGNYFLPGGHIEFGERAKEALRREIEEEIGMSVSIGRFLGAAEHSFVWRQQRTCEINLVFELRMRSLNPFRRVPSKEEKLEFLWMPLSRLNRTKLEPFTLRKQIPAWLKNGASVERWSSTF